MAIRRLPSAMVEMLDESRSSRGADINCRGLLAGQHRQRWPVIALPVGGNVGNGNVYLMSMLRYALRLPRHCTHSLSRATDIGAIVRAGKNHYAQEVHSYPHQPHESRGWDDAASAEPMKLILMQCVRCTCRRVNRNFIPAKP